MGADEFLDYILGFIFYKYLSEKAIAFADDILEGEDIQFLELNKSNAEYTQYIDVIKQSSIEEVGYPNFIQLVLNSDDEQKRKQHEAQIHDLIGSEVSFHDKQELIKKFIEDSMPKMLNGWSVQIVG